ncbi:hypothetical protein [Chelativorans sp. AA-79]|uniref:hypothetical protein n=1 Tax=Chelativorans sp. AA-79 TaxID=3028735 RepID=UPI0023F94E9A|nr:hypothetical protein [Chelativorans sp. AA-79]WEX08317.1 hypothetical protein PVE73_19890 [Chelativorans sp. AA-79]
MTAALALADALPDFGAGRPSAKAHPPAVSMEDERRQTQPRETEEMRIARAVAAAEEALRERLVREHEDKLAAERERHQAELAALTSSLGEEASRIIAERFADMDRQVLSVTGAAVARILGAILTEDLQKQAVDELAHVLAETMKDGGAVRIRVNGPASLRSALEERLGERARQVEFVDAPGVDLTAEIDEALVETRLAEWSEALAEVLP